MQIIPNLYPFCIDTSVPSRALGCRASGNLEKYSTSQVEPLLRIYESLCINDCYRGTRTVTERVYNTKMMPWPQEDASFDSTNNQVKIMFRTEDE